MCIQCCSRLTWQCGSCLVALFGLAVSFVFGPFYIILYFTNQTDLPSLLLIESENAAFHFYLMAIMCLVFITHVILLIASCGKNTRLITAFTFMSVIQLLLMNALGIRYFVLCTFIDKKCFDHSKDRPAEENDTTLALGILMMTVIYDFVWLAIIFVACNLKLVLTYVR